MKVTEETVTKAIICWLDDAGWEIICFDFPQSGTGVMLHPNNKTRGSKNKGAIIPDIVAVKNHVVVFFENKDRFFLSDFVKTQGLRDHNDYSNAIAYLLASHDHSKIVYGVGLPHSAGTEIRVKNELNKVDFVVFYADSKIEVFFDSHEVF